MGILSKEEGETYVDLSELCDEVRRASDGLGDSLSPAGLRSLRDQYDDITGHYLVDPVVADRKRLQTLTFLYLSLQKLRQLDPRNFDSELHSHSAVSSSSSEKVSPERLYPLDIEYINPNVSNDLDAEITPENPRSQLRIFFLFKEALEEYHTERSNECRSRFCDALTTALNVSRPDNPKPSVLSSSPPRPSSIAEILSVDRTQEGTQALISWKPTQAVLSRDFFDGLFLRRDEVKQVKDINRACRGFNRIECTVDWRDTLIALPAGVSLARLQTQGFRELENALNTSNRVHQSRTDPDNKLVSTPVYTLVPADFPPSPKSLASDNEIDEENRNRTTACMSNKGCAPNQIGGLCQGFDSVPSDLPESESGPSTKENVKPSKSRSATPRGKPMAKLLRELGDYNKLGEKESAVKESGSEPGHRLRNRKLIDHCVLPQLSGETGSSLTVDNGSDSISLNLQNPGLRGSSNDDASPLFVKRSNARELDSPARSPSPIATGNSDPEAYVSSATEASNSVRVRTPKQVPLSMVKRVKSGQKRALSIRDNDVNEPVRPAAKRMRRVRL